MAPIDPRDYAQPHLRPVPAPQPVERVEHAIAQLANDAQRQAVPVTDIQYVANSIDACRYLDLKKIATEILGTEKRDEITPAVLADLTAEWAAANKSKVQA